MVGVLEVAACAGTTKETKGTKGKSEPEANFPRFSLEVFHDSHYG